MIIHSDNRSGGLQLGLAAVFLMLAAPCASARDDIKVYRVAKEPAWTQPEDWTEVAPGEMRVASFNVKGKDGKQADVSVIPLPGAAGGDAANINRWRSQVALPALPPDELKQTAEAVKVGGLPGELYDLSGTNTSSGEPTRVLGVIQHREGMAWFFKMTGDHLLVAQQKPAFIEFLKMFKFAARRAPATLPSSQPPVASDALPPGHPDISSTPAPTGEPAREGQPKWQVPTGWKEVPGGQFLVAKFMVTGPDNAQAAVNVSVSGGGLAANVNRWRDQLGLPPASEADLQSQMKSLDVDGGKAALVELGGTDKTTRRPAKLVGVIIGRADGTWFYKLMGEPKLVEAQTAAFKTFVQTVKY